MFLLAGGNAAQAANILVNPGFEDPTLAPWFQATGPCGCSSDWAVTTAQHHSGAQSATGAGNNQLRQNFSPVPTSSIDQASYWINFIGGITTQTTAYDFFYSDLSDHQFTKTFTTSGWHFVDGTSNLSPGLNLTGFAVWAGTGTQTYLDDATINATPEPSSFVLFVTGLAGVAGAIRRKRGCVKSPACA
jgi:hypothetical protein